MVDSSSRKGRAGRKGKNGRPQITQSYADFSRLRFFGFIGANLRLQVSS